MAITFTPISTTTLTTTTATVTFSSIPATFTDLFLRITPYSATNVDVQLNFNGDTTSNYNVTGLSGFGTGVTAFRTGSISILYTDYYGPSNPTTSLRQVNIMNYANTSMNKTVLSRSSNSKTPSNGGIDALVGMWRSTTAITSILISLNSSASFLAKSNFSLYGIKAAL